MNSQKLLPIRIATRTACVFIIESLQGLSVIGILIILGAFLMLVVLGDSFLMSYLTGNAMERKSTLMMQLTPSSDAVKSMKEILKICKRPIYAMT